MKVTKKEVTKSVENVLEITKDEFLWVTSTEAAKFLEELKDGSNGNAIDVDDELFFIVLLGAYTSCVCSKLFDENDKDESEEK